MTKKQVLRTVAFALLVCLMLTVMMELFESKNSDNHDQRFYSLRTMEENTLDAVLIGSSGIDRYWIAAKAFEEYGMSTYTLSAEALPIWLYINMIEEVLAKQTPELFILDIRGLTQQHIWAPETDSRVRPVLCAMDFFSRNRWDATIKSSRILHEINPSLPEWDLSLFFPFIKFHSSWADKDFTFKDNWGARKHEYGGFQMNNLTTRIQEQKPVLYETPLVTDLHPITERALYELLDYIREKDLNVLFLNTPQIRDEFEEGFTNKVYTILEEEGMNYIAYYLPEQEAPMGEHKSIIDLELNGDFYNPGHTNYYGAEKFTAEFAAYLDEHFDLPDRRGDEKCQKLWEGVYGKLKEQVALVGPIVVPPAEPIVVPPAQ